jgi:hypothetical protein
MSNLRTRITAVLDAYGVNDDPDYFPGFDIMVDDLIYEAVSVSLLTHILHKCDEADSFGDDIETEDVRNWLKEFKP